MRKIVIVLTLLLAVPASAENAKVDGIAIVLPAGYCELQPSNKSDTRVLTAIRGMIEPIGNSLLSAAAECSTLEKWRASKVTRLPNMTQYQMYLRETKDGSQSEMDAAVHAVCEELRATGKKQAEEMNPSVKERAAKVMEKIEYGKIEMIGVTGEEPGVCYVSLLQKFRAEDKSDVVQLVTYANTLIKGKWVYFYQFTDYENADSVLEALGRHKASVRAFLAANGR